MHNNGNTKKGSFNVGWQANGGCSAFEESDRDEASFSPYYKWVFTNGSNGGGVGLLTYNFRENMQTRGDQVISVDEFGPDLSREMSFAFIKQDLIDTDMFPEVGDVISWHEDYFMVDTVRENQFFLGRDKQYNLTSYGNQFGSSVSIVLDTHLTRIEDLGINFSGMPNEI
jgi:hypothetical protein